MQPSGRMQLTGRRGRNNKSALKESVDRSVQRFALAQRVAQRLMMRPLRPSWTLSVRSGPELISLNDSDNDDQVGVVG